MNEITKTILADYEVRKTKEQKETFRSWLCERLKAAGYAPKVETQEGLITSHNVVVGDPDRAKVLLTAHYDTCAVLPIANFVTPCSLLMTVLYMMLLCAVLIIVIGGLEFALMLLGVPAMLSMLMVDGLLLFIVWWTAAGKANKHTANDNTSGVMTLLEIALTLPEEERDKVCFVFFDNEEKGLFGSGAFVKAHPKARRDTLCLNFDCVSDGDHIRLFPQKAVKKDEETLAALDAAFCSEGDKHCETVRGFGFYPSDQGKFRRGVGVAALNRNKLIGCYMNRIHTKRDTVMDERNIELLRRSVLRFLAAQ